MQKIKIEIIEALKYKKENPEISNMYIYKKYNIDKKTLKKYIESDFIKILETNKKNFVVDKDFVYYFSDKDLKIIDLYKNGESAYQIRLKYGVHIERWYPILEIMGISTEKRYKLNWDRNAFLKISTEEDAYFLGFILADGYLHEKKHALKIELQESDMDILEKFCKYMKIDKNHIKSKVHSITKNIEKSVYFSDINFYKNLKQYGLEQAKSTKEIFYKKMPKKLIKHYIRGIIDGDGFITKDSKGIGVCGSEDVLRNIDDYFIKELDINTERTPHRLRYDKSSNIYRLNYSGQNAKKIITFLYKDSNIYLNRKYELAKKCFELPCKN